MQVHFYNSGWMWSRSHFGWMEFYNKVQVLDPWDFTSKSTVESSLMDMARHAMLVTHICSIRQLQIDLPVPDWSKLPGRAFGVRFRCPCVQVVLIILTCWDLETVFLIFHILRIDRQSDTQSETVQCTMHFNVMHFTRRLTQVLLLQILYREGVRQIFQLFH